MIAILDHNGVPVPKIEYDEPKTIIVVGDTEADISSLGSPVVNGDTSVPPQVGSIAFVADGSAKYVFSPSGVWTKHGGAT